MFKESLEKYGSLNALASKKNGKWEKITFSEYYCLSRKAAKGFLKVGTGNKTNSFFCLCLLKANKTPIPLYKRLFLLIEDHQSHSLWK